MSLELIVERAKHRLELRRAVWDAVRAVEPLFSPEHVRALEKAAHGRLFAGVLKSIERLEVGRQPCGHPSDFRHFVPLIRSRDAKLGRLWFEEKFPEYTFLERREYRCQFYVRLYPSATSDVALRFGCRTCDADRTMVLLREEMRAIVRNRSRIGAGTPSGTASSSAPDACD